MVRVSALQLVDLGSIPLSSHTKRLQKVISTDSLLGAQHLKEVVENKPASSLVVSLGKAFNGMPLVLCIRQVVQMPRIAHKRQWQTTAVSCQENFMSIRFMSIVYEVTRSRY